MERKSQQLLQRLLEHGPVQLDRLFEGSQSRSEIVATFLALLELCRRANIAVDEDETGEIQVSFMKLPEEET